MEPIQRLCTALDGHEPDVTPLSFYSWMASNSDPVDPGCLMADSWKRLYDRGLVICHHIMLVDGIEHGVQDAWSEYWDGPDLYKIHTKETPAGKIREVFKNRWRTEHFIKTPGDYKVFQWITEHTELVPKYDHYAVGKELIGDYGVVVIRGSRTPAMSINVDLAGTEQFCMDLATQSAELLDLYQAKQKLFLKETELIANGPGKYVKWFENLTISMIGPVAYNAMLMNIYGLAVPVLEKSGKRVMVHYDGALQVISDQIAAAPFHMIESLTEPPEGDMWYDQCRRVWPEKVLWCNLNVDLYHQPEHQLQQAVSEKRQRLGKKGVAFELSEDLPSNWQRSIPVVLKTLESLG